jgi:hypothetical protein
VFVGQFCFTDRPLLTGFLKSDEFLPAIQKYSEKVPFKFIEVTEWHDVGHLDRYYKSKQMVAARFFNTIKIDNRRGILVKQSDDKEKLVKEIQWYLKLPISLKYMAPNIFDYSVDAESAFVKMEYYTYATLHEIFLFGDMPPSVWDNIIANLMFYLNEMQCFKAEVTHLEFKECVNEMYYNKTISRLNKYCDIDFNKNIIINRIEYKPLQFYMDSLDKILYLSGIYDRDTISVIHGDYCASNILIDNKRNIIRLVDPRGSFGKYDIYGDPIYDIAKLMHSFDGKYDFIIADNFTVKCENNTFEYRLFISEKQKQVSDKLVATAKKTYADDFIRIKLVESLLFLSMLPLHSDKPDRQKAFLCIGVELLDFVCKELRIL